VTAKSLHKTAYQPPGDQARLSGSEHKKYILRNPGIILNCGGIAILN
jgi:hypothetical protein